MQLWIAGNFIRESNTGVQWNLLGVFDTQAAAEAQCFDSYCFIAPALLNRPLPDENPWRGAYYPLQRSVVRVADKSSQKSPERN